MTIYEHYKMRIHGLQQVAAGAGEESDFDLKNDRAAGYKSLGTSFEQFMKIFNEDLSGWKKVKTTKEKDFLKYGIKAEVYQRKQEGSKINLIRLDSTMKNLDCEKYVGSIANPTDTSMYKEYKVIENMPNGDVIVYQRVGLPLVNDRDCCFNVHTEKTDGEGVYLNCESIERDDFPTIKKIVRMYSLTTGWLRPHPTEKDLTLYTEFSINDLKGNFPASLINSMMVGEIYGVNYMGYQACKKAE